MWKEGRIKQRKKIIERMRKERKEQRKTSRQKGRKERRKKGREGKIGCEKKENKYGSS